MKKKSIRMPAIFKKAEIALKLAVQQAFLEHKREGLPVYVWEKNKVVAIPPYRIRIRRTRRSL